MSRRAKMKILVQMSGVPQSVVGTRSRRYTHANIHGPCPGHHSDSGPRTGRSRPSPGPVSLAGPTLGCCSRDGSCRRTPLLDGARPGRWILSVPLLRPILPIVLPSAIPAVHRILSSVRSDHYGSAGYYWDGARACHHQRPSVHFVARRRWTPVPVSLLRALPPGLLPVDLSPV